jgi:hypothetical protein
MPGARRTRNWPTRRLSSTKGIDEPLLAFKRGSGDDQVTVLMNMTGEEREMRLHNYDLIEDVTGQRLLGPGEYVDIKIPPYGLLVKAADETRPFPQPSGAQGQWQRADGTPLIKAQGDTPGQSWGDRARNLLREIVGENQENKPAPRGPQTGGFRPA